MPLCRKDHPSASVHRLIWLSRANVTQCPPSFDKQFVRDYLETPDWNKTPPGPKLPPEIIEKTAAKYREAFERLTGTALA